MKVSQIKKASRKTIDYNKDTDTIIKSFTEPDIFIYSKPDYHANVMNGKFVKGGSSFKKHFTHPFDMELRANGLAKHWGVKPSDIIKMWKYKGKSTSSFGSGFHKILELDINHERWDVSLIEEPIKQTRSEYMQLLDIGEAIYKNSKSAEENYAKPTHLDIRNLMKADTNTMYRYAKDVVREFYELDSTLRGIGDSVLTEVYVTYSPLGMGGEIDNLLITDMKNKVCRVRDYKFKDKELDKESSNNELINELAKKKASENDVIKIQLSFYAYCLQKAGWTVEGGDVFGRNGEWKHYPIELIPFEQMDELVNKYLG